MRRLWTWALYVNMGLTLVAVGVVIVLPGFNVLHRLNALLSTSPPPIVIHGQRFEWVGARTLQSTSQGTTWTRTCKIVFTSRGALTTDGDYVGLTDRVISGPLKGATFDPRWQIEDMTPQERPGSVIQYDVPLWVKDHQLDDLQTFNMVQRTPLDTATDQCPAGQWASNVTIPKNSEWRAAHGLGPRASSVP